MKNNKILKVAVTIMILFSMLSTTVFAQAPDQFGQSFEEMSDEYMQKVLKDYHVAGATVSVVKDGKLFFKKGYGYADAANKTKVSPDKTAFQIASVSKLFTATAAMQMVEQGKLSLDVDVNNYLTAFKIKNPYSKPVTLQNLLTHTSGLDDKQPLYIRSSGNVLFNSLEPLEEVLKKNMPPVVREPGTFCQYSIYGMALVGYLVEKVSGMPIDQYITKNILNPLDMKHSSYGLNSSILPNMSKPYKYQNDKYVESAYTLISDHPNGSICATASDMTKFMLMHLDDGQYNGNRILTESSAINMHKHQYPSDSKLTGYGLGFNETIRNGHRTIEHGGYLPSFSSKLTLMPEGNIGMFVAINTDSKDSSKVCNEFVDKFYNFFTDKIDNIEAKSALSNHTPFDMDAGKIDGSYVFDGYGQTDVTKIKSVMVTCNVKCDSLGKLTFASDNLKWNFDYIGNGLFYCKDNGNWCKVSEINNKTVLNVLGSDYEKVSDFNQRLFIVAIFSLPIFLITIIFLIASLIKNRKRQNKFALAHKFTMLALSIFIISYFGLNIFMALKCMMADTYIVINLIMPLITVICCLCLGLTFASLVLVVLSWAKNRDTLRFKVLYTILSVFSVINIVFMYVMNGMKI